MNTTYLNNKRLDNEYRGQAWTPPAPMYLGYLTASWWRGTGPGQTVSANQLVAVQTSKGAIQLYMASGSGALSTLVNQAAINAIYVGNPGETVFDGVTLVEQTAVLLAGSGSGSGISSSAAEPPTAGTGYARISLNATLAAINGTQGTAGSPSNGAPVISGGIETPMSVTNAAQLTFPAPLDNWFAYSATLSSSGYGVAWAIGRFDSATVGAGNLLEICPLQPLSMPAYVKSGDQAPIVAAGDLAFSLL